MIGEPFDVERNLVSHVFGGLTLLDTVQSDTGMDLYVLMRAYNTKKQFSTNILSRIIHAKSYFICFLNTQYQNARLIYDLLIDTKMKTSNTRPKSQQHLQRWYATWEENQSVFS